MSGAAEFIRDSIRTVPDWPKPGIMFRDITPLLSDARAYRVLIDIFAQRYLDSGVEFVAGIDARGFILGAVLARELNAGFLPVRKKGKLPFKTIEESYSLEYGQATVEIHADACAKGHRVLLMDDLVATGGTMRAAALLLKRLGAEVTETAAIVDLPDLGGSAKLRADGLGFFAICEFAGH